MNKYIFCFIFSSAIVTVFGQDFKKSLPKAGDIHFRCKTSDRPAQYLFEKKDGIWNFNFLDSYFCVEEKFQAAKKGRNFGAFNKAELVLEMVNNEEEYFYVRNASLFSLGKALEVPFLKSGKLFLQYKPHNKVYRGDIAADQATVNVYTLECKMGLNDFWENPGVFPPLTDSVLVEIKVNEKILNTDDGTLVFQSSTRHAQKQEFIVTTTTRFKFKTKGKSMWADYFDVKLNKWPASVQKIFRMPQRRVVFLSNEYRGATLSYEIYDGEIDNIEFQNDNAFPASHNISADESEIIMIPNPSYGLSELYFINLPFDNYRLEISNLIGQKVLSKPLGRDLGREIMLELNQLRKGTYIYHVINSKGEKISTKRLTISSI